MEPSKGDRVTCYTRHLAEFLPPDPTAEDRRELDERIRSILGLGEATCPEVWSAVKKRRHHPAFVARATPTSGRRAS